MDWERRVRLLSWGLNNPVSAVLWLMRVEREVRLLRVVAVMVMEMRVALNRGVIGTTVAIVVGVWAPPYLSLLRPSRWPFILVGVAMRLISPLRPLLLLVRMHPRTLVREVAVIAPPTHVVMRVVAAASLASNLSANWRWSLIGCPRGGAGLLDGSQSTLSHAVWRSVAPGPFGHIVILQSLLLPERGC